MGDGRSGAGGGFSPRLGFCGTVPDSPVPPLPVPAEPVDVPEPPSACDDELFVFRTAGEDVFDGTGEGEAEAEGVGVGLAEGAPLTEADTEPAGERSVSTASPAPPPPPAEQPATHRTASATAAHALMPHAPGRAARPLEPLIP